MGIVKLFFYTLTQFASTSSQALFTSNELFSILSSILEVKDHEGKSFIHLNVESSGHVDIFQFLLNLYQVGKLKQEYFKCLVTKMASLYNTEGTPLLKLSDHELHDYLKEAVLSRDALLVECLLALRDPTDHLMIDPNQFSYGTPKQSILDIALNGRISYNQDEVTNQRGQSKLMLPRKINLLCPLWFLPTLP